jgi:hypothetical protein
MGEHDSGPADRQPAGRLLAMCPLIQMLLGWP